MGMKKDTVILFPFMAQGHMIPFLALAKLIQQTKCSVMIINTPRNINTLRSNISATTTRASEIQFLELPFNPIDHGLPPESENTDSLTFPFLLRLFTASESLQPAFTQFLSKNWQSTLCIISDFFFGWTVAVADKYKVPHFMFSGGGASGFAIDISIWLHLPHRNTESEDFLLPDIYPPVKIHRSQMSKYLKEANGKDPWSLFLQTQLTLSLQTDGFLFNSIESIEEIGLNYFKKKTGRPAWTIGPLISGKRCEDKTGCSSQHIVEWLDGNIEMSVLYISFGSMNTISVQDMMNLALGLESSGRKFIWVVRPPFGFSIQEEFRAEWLPTGFENRMKESKQGIMVRNWAPQIEILSHKSTGAFLSHCGWNSVIESLNHGIPIIGWPIAAEQFYNSMILEEQLGVCVEIGRGIESGIRPERVVELINLVMGESEKAEEMKSKAVLIMKEMRNATKVEEGYRGSSVKAMDDFLNTANLLRAKKRGSE